MRASVSKHHQSLGGLTTEIHFSQYGGRVRMKTLANSVSDEHKLRGSQVSTCLLTVPPLAEGARGLLYKDTNPIYGAAPSYFQIPSHR